MQPGNGLPPPLASPAAGREGLAFLATLSLLLVLLLGDTLTGRRVLSPADVLFAQRAWLDAHPDAPAPSNRLLMDPVLQFEPWIDLCRQSIRRGQIPLWNDLAGCGAPFLANGQCAFFDPFHWIAFVGPMPTALAWMAFARLLVAGIGIFVLARSWGLGAGGRWFAGLVYPLSGYLIVWLLYPLPSVAAWMPWLLWSVGRLRACPSHRWVVATAILAGLVMVGGHVQTSVHVLIAACLYALGGDRAFWTRFSTAMMLGFGISAAAWLPLADYLGKSPAWSDRQADHRPPTEFRPVRWKEGLCWAVPYLYGSQRGDMPNLARAVGAENLNESAGGYAGLATLIWLAPLGVIAGRREPAARALAGLLVLGALGSLQVPPVDNLLRALPVLNVMDHRRLTLWVGFAIVGLGAFGVDRLERMRASRGWELWAAGWVVAAMGLLAVAAIVPAMKGKLLEKAEAHYLALLTDPAKAAHKAEEQAAMVVGFLPVYYAAVAVLAIALAVLAVLYRRGRVSTAWARRVVILLVLLDLFAFGRGLNPAIDPAAYRPAFPLIELLREIAPPPRRLLAIGEELPPNFAMRYGLADVRNYDSIELSRSLDWFEPIYEPELDRPVRSSRRKITWEGVARGAERLRTAGVVAVVGSTEPPPGLFGRLHRIGSLFVGEWEPASMEWDVKMIVNSEFAQPITSESSWRAEDASGPVALDLGGPFLRPARAPSSREIKIEYRPVAVRWGFAVAGMSAGLLVLLGGIAPEFFDSKPLGAFPSEALESMSCRPGPTRIALPEGQHADDPLQV